MVCYKRRHSVKRTEKTREHSDIPSTDKGVERRDASGAQGRFRIQAGTNRRRAGTYIRPRQVPNSSHGTKETPFIVEAVAKSPAFLEGEIVSPGPPSNEFTTYLSRAPFHDRRLFLHHPAPLKKCAQNVYLQHMIDRHLVSVFLNAQHRSVGERDARRVGIRRRVRALSARIWTWLPITRDRSAHHAKARSSDRGPGPCARLFCRRRRRRVVAIALCSAPDGALRRWASHLRARGAPRPPTLLHAATIPFAHTTSWVGHLSFSFSLCRRSSRTFVCSRRTQLSRKPICVYAFFGHEPV